MCVCDLIGLITSQFLKCMKNNQSIPFAHCMMILMVLESTALPVEVGLLATHLYVAVSSFWALTMVSLLIATYGDLDGIATIVLKPRRFAVWNRNGFNNLLQKLITLIITDHYYKRQEPFDALTRQSHCLAMEMCLPGGSFVLFVMRRWGLGLPVAVHSIVTLSPTLPTYSWDAGVTFVIRALTATNEGRLWIFKQWIHQ